MAENTPSFILSLVAGQPARVCLTVADDGQPDGSFIDLDGGGVPYEVYEVARPTADLWRERQGLAPESVVTA